MKIMKDYVARTATLIPDEGEILAEGLKVALADVTANPGVDTATIDIPKDEMNGHVDTLLQFGFKIHHQIPTTLTMIRVLR
jgi:hypothetical protein